MLCYTFSCIADNIYIFIFAVQTSTPGCCQKRLEVSLAREKNIKGSAFHPVLPGEPTAGWLWAQVGRQQKRCLCLCCLEPAEPFGNLTQPVVCIKETVVSCTVRVPCSRSWGYLATCRQENSLQICSSKLENALIWFGKGKGKKKKKEERNKDLFLLKPLVPTDNSKDCRSSSVQLP